MNNLSWQYIKQLKDTNAIAKLAATVGITLSEDVVSFLKQHNGGRPDKKCFDTNLSKERMIKSLLSFNEDDRGSAHAVVPALKKDKSGLFPFASDPGGNYICIDAAGKIVFWLHETNEVEAISNSFTEFFLALYN